MRVNSPRDEDPKSTYYFTIVSLKIIRHIVGTQWELTRRKEGKGKGRRMDPLIFYLQLSNFSLIAPSSSK